MKSKAVGGGQDHLQVKQREVDVFLGAFPVLLQRGVFPGPEREHILSTGRRRRIRLALTFPPLPPDAAADRQQEEHAGDGRDYRGHHALAGTAPAVCWDGKQAEQEKKS